MAIEPARELLIKFLILLFNVGMAFVALAAVLIVILIILGIVF